MELLQELAGLFLDECPQRMAEIREAIARRDAAALEQAAHALKGSVANFGARAAIEAAHRLEMAGARAGLGATRTRPGPRWRTAIGRLTPALAELGRAEAS